MPKFGALIQKLRKQKKMTQAQLAEAAQLNYRHYQNVEYSKTDLKISTAEDIARALKIPVHFLLNKKADLKVLNFGIECYSDLLDLLPVGVCLINLEGRIDYTNRYFENNLTYMTKEQLAKNPYVWELLIEENRPQGQIKYDKVNACKPSPYPAKHMYLGPGKKPIEVCVNWDYVRTEDQQIQGYFATIMLSSSLAVLANTES